MQGFPVNHYRDGYMVGGILFDLHIEAAQLPEEYILIL
jgi:hypothetical protein